MINFHNPKTPLNFDINKTLPKNINIYLKQILIKMHQKITKLQVIVKSILFFKKIVKILTFYKSSFALI